VNEFLQLIISGTATGAIYALAALGFTLLWQASGTINFAQGEFVMVPAIVTLVAMSYGLPMWLAFLLACAASMLLLEVFGQKRLLKWSVPGIAHAVTFWAFIILTLTIIEAVGALFDPHFFLPIIGKWRLVGFVEDLIGTLLLAGAIVFGLQTFLNKTITGRAMQAVAQNTESATVLGIDVKRMILYVFLINALLAAVAALLVTPTYLAKFDMGDTIGLKAFYAAIIGGFNQTRGALLGGVLVGVLENLTGAYLSPAYKEGVALMLFLVVILVKPEGLLGKAEERKV